MIWSLLVTSMWLTLGTYATWFFFRAETVQPLALEDLVLAYKLHKKQAKCPVQRVHTLYVKNRGIVGFRCGCGYEYVQKRLLSQKIRRRKQNDTIHTTYYELSNLFETKKRLQEMGLEYYKIKKFRK
jgi:hypothetical protein